MIPGRQVDDVQIPPSPELVAYWQQVGRTVLCGDWAANWPEVSVRAVLRKCARVLPRSTYPRDVEHDLHAMANLVFAVDYAREVQQLAAERLEGCELVEAAIAGQAEALLQLQARGAPFGDAAVEAMRPIDRRGSRDRWRVDALERQLRRAGLAEAASTMTPCAVHLVQPGRGARLGSRS